MWTATNANNRLAVIADKFTVTGANGEEITLIDSISALGISLTVGNLDGVDGYLPVAEYPIVGAWTNNNYKLHFTDDAALSITNADMKASFRDIAKYFVSGGHVLSLSESLVTLKGTGNTAHIIVAKRVGGRPRNSHLR